MILRPLAREEVRAVDRRAIEEYGLPGIVLMENAGRNTAMLLHALGPGMRVAIVCGRGNNAGDGFVIARHLENLGHEVRLLLACRRTDLRGDAAINAAVATHAGIPMVDLTDGTADDWAAAVAGADWIVDAVLGTGASGPPRGSLAVAIRAIRAAREAGGVRVLAVDLPSGLDCDTGDAPGDCVRADLTATFVAPKLGFGRPGAAALTGTVEVIDIGVPRRLLADVAGG